MIYRYTPVDAVSKDEIVKRLINGEVFYLGSRDAPIRLYYDPHAEIPFRAGDGAMSSSWRHWREFMFRVEGEWHDEPRALPRLCWVSHGCSKEKLQAAVIVKVDNECRRPFFSAFSAWEHATPLTPEEADRYVK